MSPSLHNYIFDVNYMTILFFIFVMNSFVLFRYFVFHKYAMLYFVFIFSLRLVHFSLFAVHKKKL